MEWLDNIPAVAESLMPWVAAIGGIHVAATAFTAMTPTQVDDRAHGAIGKVLNYGLRVLNVLAGNVGKNRNADDPPRP